MKFFNAITSVLGNKFRESEENKIPSIDDDLVRRKKEREKNQTPSSNYLKRIHESNITTYMRRTAVDMLAEVAEQLFLDLDTLHMTVNYMDIYLSMYAIKKERLILVAITCLIMTAKYEKQDVPLADVFSNTTSDTYCSIERVLEMEFKVCHVLNYELSIPTARSFLRQFPSAPDLAATQYSTGFNLPRPNNMRPK
ncbi:CYCA1-2 [Linum grandiflorum]